MNIPTVIVNKVKQTSSPLENRWFIHAEKALNSINCVTTSNYCYDDISRCANTLERLYKGFLQAANDHCDFYSLPSPDFLNADHDILGMVLEIKQHFTDVFPYMDRSDWREMKNFYRDLRKVYTESRYMTYPSYEEFLQLKEFTNQQFEMIYSYIKEGKLTKDYDFELDY